MSITSLFMLLATIVGAARQSESDALRQTAPIYLVSAEMARLHLAAATFAGEAFSVDPALMLSITWFESRYDATVAYREGNGMLSCGLMQVTMQPGEPCPAPDVLDSYLRGAEHLRGWLKVCGDSYACAMRGYAGGFPAIEQCGKQTIDDAFKDVCARIEARHHRAAWIRSSMQRAAKGEAPS